MRAVRIERMGGPEVIEVAEVDVPEPGADEALVRIDVAGLNFIDTYQRSGIYPVELPYTLGQEAAGTIEAVGADVDGLSPGDRVAYTGVPGAYAEYAVAAASQLVAVPHAVEPDVAAATMLQGMTAHYLVDSTFPLDDRHTALVTAAAGGVGHVLVQLAKRRGARVIATVSTDEKERLARAAGADEVIRYRDVDLVAEVRRLTDGDGVEVVYESVGKDTFEHSLRVLKPRGMLVLYGQSSGRVGPIDPQILNQHGSLYLTRPSLAYYIADRDELLRRAGELFDLIVAGELDVRIDRRFALEDAADAHRYIESGATKGKVLLVP